MNQLPWIRGRYEAATMGTKQYKADTMGVRQV